MSFRRVSKKSWISVRAFFLGVMVAGFAIALLAPKAKGWADTLFDLSTKCESYCHETFNRITLMATAKSSIECICTGEQNETSQTDSINRPDERVRKRTGRKGSAAGTHSDANRNAYASTDSGTNADAGSDSDSHANTDADADASGLEALRHGEARDSR